ncbi:MAG: hypothetical protein Q8K89_09055, partial [Actinomycetota bacterium]|nr:hypothetical protein [Actinomycetota bacterium]
YALVAFSLMLLLRRKIGAFGMYGIAWMLTRAAMASALGGATAWGIVRLTPTLTDMPGGFLIQLAVAGSFGLLVSFAAAALMRVPEVAVVTGLLQRILRRKRAT